MISIPGIHFLNADSIVILNKLISNLEMEVPPLIPHLLVGFGDEYSGLSPSVRGFYPARQPLLPIFESFLSLLEKSGIFYFDTIRYSQKAMATDIYSYRFASGLKGSRINSIARETDVPLASACPADGNGLDCTLNRSGQAQLEPANVCDTEVFALQPPARLLECEAVIPVPAFEAREAGLVSILDPTKEPFVGFVQPLKHFLENLGAYLTVFRKGILEFWQLLDLVKTGDRAMILSVNGNTLLKSGIIEITTKVKPIVGFLKSLWTCQKAIFEGLFHLPCTVFNIAYFEKGVNPPRADSLSVSPALKCGVLYSVIL